MNPASISSAPVPSTPDLWMTLIKSVAMLSLVLGILFAALYLIRRFYWRYSGASDRGLIRMLATHHVAPKERVVLLEVLGEKILIGVTPQQINYLATISNGQEINIPQSSEKQNFFSNLLTNAMGKQLRNG